MGRSKQVYAQAKNDGLELSLKQIALRTKLPRMERLNSKPCPIERPESAMLFGLS